MNVRRIDRTDIVGMLRFIAAEEGSDLRWFYEQGQAGTLDNPRLRDLWLIWGTVLEEPDLDAVG